MIVHFKQPTQPAFHTVQQEHSDPLPAAGDVVDVGGSNWEVRGRYLLYGPGSAGIREVVVFVRPVEQ